MFGSTILDVLLGVIFTFLAVSLAASIGTEAIASLLKLRQATLKSGIQALVNDPGFNGLARQLYGHALVNPLTAGTAVTTLPAYIDGRAFSIALLDLLRRPDSDCSMAETLSDVPDEQLRQTLQALLAEADGEVDRFRTAVGAWFDAAMDRLSGWYKRRSQLIAFLVGMLVATALNADPLRITVMLWQHPALAASLAATAGSDEARFDTLLPRLDAATIIGWQGWAPPTKGWPWPSLAAMAGGWLLAAAASLFGAPFWFDMLQRVVAIRGTGQRPIGRDSASR